MTTGAVLASGPVRALEARELAQVCAFVLGVSVAVIVALRWFRTLFKASGPRVGAPSGVVAGLAVIISMFAPTIFLRQPPNTNESATLGDIRILLEGETAYQAASGGAYGPPECLAAPTSCLPGYGVGQPTFLDSDLASLTTKSGYKRTFHPGAAAPPPADGKPAPKGGLASYAYSAVPDRPGLTGTRGFCADSTGRICFMTDGSAPPVTDGSCAPTCNALR